MPCICEFNVQSHYSTRQNFLVLSSKSSKKLKSKVLKLKPCNHRYHYLKSFFFSVTDRGVLFWAWVFTGFFGSYCENYSLNWEYVWFLRISELKSVKTGRREQDRNNIWSDNGHRLSKKWFWQSWSHMAFLKKVEDSQKGTG